jgi:diguanylate cyclase (GGDEF)-like protein
LTFKPKSQKLKVKTRKTAAAVFLVLSFNFSVSSSTAAAAVFLVLTFNFSVLSSTAAAQPFGERLLPRTAEGGIPNPASIPISPRRAAAFAALVACGLLLLQYAHRRKPFIIIWAGGWLLIAPAMLLLARGYPTITAGRIAIGVAQFLLVCSATMFLWSADRFRQTRFVQPSWLRVYAGLALWFILSPLALGLGSVVVPGYVLAAVAHAGAGAMFAAVLIERRMIGAGLNAFVLFGLAISNIATIFLIPQMLAVPRYALTLLLVNAVLHIFGALGINILVFEDMTYELRLANRRLEAAREELLQAAITDPLTGCHNRRFLEQVIDRELQRHTRFHLPLSLLFIDIDRFKAVNDTLGHEAGDRVLRYVSRFLKRHIREADYIFRWGGDEFLVLITCSAEEAARKATVLKAAFDAAPEAVDLPPGIGLSVGSIEVPEGTTDLMPIISKADEKMYEDKGKQIGNFPIAKRAIGDRRSEPKPAARSPWRRRT